MIESMVGAVVDTIQGLLAGIGTALSEYFIFTFTEYTAAGDPVVYTVTSLNPLGLFMFALLGVGAAFGVAKLIFSLVRFRG
jgi:phage-related protein